MKNCLHCGKEFDGRKDKKFCSSICSSRYHSRKKHNLLKENPDYKKLAKEKFGEWMKSPENRLRIKEHVKQDYLKNKYKWSERRFTEIHRKEIFKFINHFCPYCGKPTKFISIINYKNKPYLKTVKMDKRKELIEKYVCENLVGVCSRECLYKSKQTKYVNGFHPHLQTKSLNI